MKRFRMPFSIALPLLELGVWVYMVLVPTTLIYWNLKQMTQGRDVTVIHSGEFSMELRKDKVASTALRFGAFRASRPLTGLNLPAMFVEVLISLPTSWPATWHPSSLSMETWRSLAFPFFCLPAWWLAGRGLDFLVSRRRLYGALTLLSGVLAATFLFLLIGLWFTMTPADRGEDTQWTFAGFLLWSLLLTAAPLGWIRQRRTRSTEKAQPPV